MTEPLVAKFHDTERVVTCIAVTRRKYLHVLCLEDAGVVVRRFPVEDAKWLRPEGMDLKEGVRRFRRLMGRVPSTQMARDFLEEVQHV